MAAPRAGRAVSARSKSAAAKYTRKATAQKLRDSHKPPPEPTRGSIHVCWCGQPHGHDWPGRDAGAPHPR